ncbi:metallophosphoesterase [Ameyamaea chiangmaiensis NBRC 103196]|uniref:Metallophosphoesterase n=1 Tax=Ameyamaea chiangmaiensis TaxID=442969 RepID=A0A850PEG6_9PROT|nr:metallophosphoesterase [Ameyamaea chiangmaiensis]MBS4075797.1 metallophosphoesterase [Ameyamaea chiangmaiensis]NVN40860.1 metallophosphoesterase [Ameyamaea chiangmaiensis]GBQ63773.1 metallophosphoesterase [Ameyamaea chiangmaiensis NBRC 103196]
MTLVSRRSLLSLTAGATFIGLRGARAGVPDRPPLRPHDPFSFLFITDTHLQPELDAARGCHAAFARARAIPSDFAIQGGDHVFDALGVNAGRATMLMDLYKRTADDLTMPVHHTIGNHDCFGVYTKSGAQPTDPFYGKKYFEDNFGRLYYAFDHKGVHFVVLDSIGITADRSYEGRIDPAQKEWLARDLAAQPAGTPIIVVTHIPLVTAVDAYSAPLPTPPKHHGISVVNAHEIVPLFDSVNVIGVLQGHTHILERVDWHGVPYITGGAVSGNWWHGTRMGTPEGFLVVDVADGRLTTRYETYGFRTVDPHNT